MSQTVLVYASAPTRDNFKFHSRCCSSQFTYFLYSAIAVWPMNTNPV